MNKLFYFIIAGAVILSALSASIARSGDHADDERMEDHISLEPSVAKIERLPAQIILNTEACENKNPSDKVEDQTDGTMVSCSEAKKEMEKLGAAKNVGY